MKNLIILLLCATSMSAQIKKTFNETISGSYNTIKTGEQILVSLNSQNHAEYKKFELDINPLYNVAYTGGKMTANEFINKTNVAFKHNSYSFYYLNQYDASFIRRIDWDEWNGLGAGKKFILSDKITIWTSYCFEQQLRKYIGSDMETIYRNSFRLKSALNYTSFTVALEYYYQPAINMDDVNIFGTSKVTILPNRPVSFVIQNTYNYMSADPVKVIQNTTFGVNINIK